MRTIPLRRPFDGVACLIVLVLGLIQSGCCITGAPRTTVPANCMPELVIGTKSHQVPIDLAFLGQSRPEEHIIGPGDTLSVYIHGVLPLEMMAAPFIQQTPSGQSDYYPPIGPIRTPPVGPSLVVAGDGTLRLPFLGNVKVSGMTLDQATEEIIRLYRKKEIIKPEHEKIIINLVRPRVHRIVVVREDAIQQINMLTIAKGTPPWIKHGKGQVIDLPAYENDVLHALTQSGGLPGIDAKAEVWIFRGAHDDKSAANMETIIGGEATLAELKQRRQFVRVPLRFCPGQPFDFDPEDVKLNDGDVVFVPSRDEEVFYTGGLLLGGQVPLPRDKDVDIVEAMSLIGASVGSAAGAGPAGYLGKSNLGYIIPPTRGVVIRKLPNGEILAIRVDMHRALNDPSERIIIQPGDQVMLYYKPHQLVCNAVLSCFNVNGAFVAPIKW